MDQSEYVAEYLSYIADTPDVKPVKQFAALATVAETPPMFFNSLPSGDVYVYPQFLAFLTLDKQGPGAGLLFKKIVDELISQGKTLYTVNKWVNNPAAILMDAAKWLAKKYQDKEKLEQALANPNSILVPFAKIISAESGRNLAQGSYIKIRTQDRTIFLCENGLHENAFAPLWNMFTGNWQADVVSMLKGAAR